MKKFRRIILWFFGIVFLIFIVPGLVSNKIEIKTVTRIHKPLSSVFITFGDPSKLTYWMEGLKKIDHIYGLPFSEGSKYRITFIVRKTRITAIEEIIKVDWKKRLVLEMKMPRMNLHADLFFSRMDEFSEIQGTYTVSGGNFITKILLPWMKPAIRKKLNGGMDRFKTVMEEKK